MKTELTDCFLKKALVKVINNGDRSTRTRTSSPHQSISAHTQIELFRWAEGKHAVCASREEGCLPPCSRQSRASTTCRNRRPPSFSTSKRSVCLVFGECCNHDWLRQEWQSSRSRHHNHSIPLARGETQCVCQWIAGHSSSITTTPMVRVACSADRCV